MEDNDSKAIERAHQYFQKQVNESSKFDENQLVEELLNDLYKINSVHSYSRISYYDNGNIILRSAIITRCTVNEDWIEHHKTENDTNDIRIKLSANGWRYMKEKIESVS